MLIYRTCPKYKEPTWFTAPIYIHSYLNNKIGCSTGYRYNILITKLDLYGNLLIRTLLLVFYNHYTVYNNVPESSVVDPLVIVRIRGLRIPILLFSSVADKLPTKFFDFLLFEGTFTLIFKNKKPKRSHKY